MEHFLEKKSGKIYHPIQETMSLVFFLEDFNMPATESFENADGGGSTQTPLAFVIQWMEYSE
jgi:hypothetical protein